MRPASGSRLMSRRHPVHPVICRSEEDQKRDHQPQLRADDRTARWHCRARAGTDDLSRSSTALRGSPSLRSFSRGQFLSERGPRRFHRSSATQPDQVEWIWRLPPDNSVLCFAEIWMKTADAAVSSSRLYRRPVSLLSARRLPALPDRRPSTVLHRGLHPNHHGEASTVWLLAVEPTILWPGSPRTWGLHDQGRAALAQNAQGPCLCGAQ